MNNMLNFKEFVNEAVNYDMFDEEKCEHEIFDKLDIKPAHITVTKGSFIVPEARIVINFTQTKNYPNGIEENAIRFIYRFFFNTSTLEYSPGHAMIWLSPYDKENDYKYHAMRSADNLAKECGTGRFRKSKAKDEADVAVKIAKHLNKVMDIVNTYTGGYPYKEGIIDTSIVDAYSNK